MRIFLLLMLFLVGFRCAPTTVYICDSPNAIRYHLKENCRGLSNCSHRILSVPLEKAQGMHLTLCKWEQ